MSIYVHSNDYSQELARFFEDFSEDFILRFYPKILLEIFLNIFFRNLFRHFFPRFFLSRFFSHDFAKRTSAPKRGGPSGVGNISERAQSYRSVRGRGALVILFVGLCSSPTSSQPVRTRKSWKGSAHVILLYTRKKKNKMERLMIRWFENIE